MSTLRIRGCETNSLPVVAPGPGRTERTPLGTIQRKLGREYSKLNFKDLPPASSAICANSSTEIGASCKRMRYHDCTWHTNFERGITSEGLTMTLFPAARAGAIFLIAMSNG
jgi:hypothetical protein